MLPFLFEWQLIMVVVCSGLQFAAWLGAPVDGFI
jgi:hypothetical protein